MQILGLPLVLKQRSNHFSLATICCKKNEFFFFFKGAKSKTIHLLVKRDQTSNGLYNISLILFLCFYKGCGGNWVGIKCLGSMSRGKGKKGGEEESKAIKSIHGKLKIMERERES